MEKQFLFGKRVKVYDYLKQENVTLTEGVWTQAGKEIHAELATLDAKAAVDILRKTFTENSGSRRKDPDCGQRPYSGHQQDRRAARDHGARPGHGVGHRLLGG